MNKKDSWSVDGSFCRSSAAECGGLRRENDGKGSSHSWSSNGAWIDVQRCAFLFYCLFTNGDMAIESVSFNCPPLSPTLWWLELDQTDASTAADGQQSEEILLYGQDKWKERVFITTVRCVDVVLLVVHGLFLFTQRTLVWTVQRVVVVEYITDEDWRKY